MEAGRWDRIRIATTWLDCFGFSPGLPSSPVPADGAINVDPALALLEWQAPTESCNPLYSVYFGTYGVDDVNFTVANTQLEDNTAATSTDPTPLGGALVMDTQYYWRVDVNSCSTYAITAIADLGGGQVRATTTGHGGEIVAALDVVITDTTDYNGTHTVTNVPDTNDFDFADTFTSSQTGNVEVPVANINPGWIWTFRTWPLEPLILTQPENALVVPGGTAQFTVVSGGNEAGSHTYQWYHYVNPGDANQVLSDGARFSGTTTNSLTVIDCRYNDDPLLNDEGFYWCRVTNTSGSTDSDSAGLMLMRLMARYDCDGNVIDGASQYDGTKVGGGGYGIGIEPWGALHLTGTDNYVYVPYIIAESVGELEDFTIAAWVKPDPGEEEAVIWAGYDDTAGGPPTDGEGISIERQADGGAFVRIEGNNPETVSSVAGAIPEDEWTHVVFVYDSNNAVGTGTLYINGEQAGQEEYDSARAQQIGPFSMGAYLPDGGPARWFLDGWLDDVRFYAYSISAVNVASLYNEIKTSEKPCAKYPKADLNSSGRVELVDYAKVLSNWLASNIVP